MPVPQPPSTPPSVSPSAPAPDTVVPPPPPLGDRQLFVSDERWPIAGSFVISRGAKSEAHVVVVEVRETLADGRVVRGRGECVPYARYGESVEGVGAALTAMAGPVADGLDTAALQAAMPAGAARNALDCALWDLEAKRNGLPVWELLGGTPPRQVVTAETISIGSPPDMANRARKLADRPLLKVKVGADSTVERVAAVRTAAPNARLIVDANEAWSERDLPALLHAMAALDVALVEQPLPAGADGALAGIDSPVPLCADESVHTAESLDHLAGLYSYVNIKLDKTGGLTAALALADASEARGFRLMVGCMLGTSLAMAPALMLAGRAEFVDLDGPVLLSRDREPGLSFRGGWISPPGPGLWG